MEQSHGYQEGQAVGGTLAAEHNHQHEDNLDQVEGMAIVLAVMAVDHLCAASQSPAQIEAVTIC